MADKLQLPFELNGTNLDPKTQANFQALIDFVNDLNTGIENLTALTVGSLTATGAVAGNSVAATTSVTGASATITNTFTNTNKLVTDSDGNVSQPNQPSFLARVGSAYTITPSGTGPTVTYDTEIFDVGGDYNTSTYTFTAPIGGYYHLFFSLYINIPVATLPDRVLIKIATSNRTYVFQQPVYDTDGTFGYVTLSASVLADMDANDTASVALFSGNDVNVLNTRLDVVGTPGNTAPVNYFMGTLIN